MIEAGDVLVNGEARKVGYRLQMGDDVEVTLRPPTEPRAEPQDIALEVLHEDAHLIVVNKPAGLVVHPAPGHPDGTLVNALLFHCDDLSGVGGELRPGIVHRLDKDTSGVMVASKDDATHAALADLFQRKDLTREYVAVVAPPPRALSGRFETLYGRHPRDRKKFSSKVTRGKKASTHYRVERRFGDFAALLRCTLATGRTHQIRVHLADHGSPVVGDPVYGRARRRDDWAGAIGRQALHAAVLAFVHPATGEPVRFETPPPEDFQTLVAALVERAALVVREGE